LRTTDLNQPPLQKSASGFIGLDCGFLQRRRADFCPACSLLGDGSDEFF
jgi:hypothetical protein